MEAANDEGEGFQHKIEGGQQERLADPFHRGDDFKLRDRVYRIDMIDAFVTIEISLMH